jgi:antitoxin MazE
MRYAFLIPLPADWAKNMNLNQGSSVSIEMLEDKSLRITPVPQVCQNFEEPRA